MKVGSMWFMRHDGQRTDIMRGAQNAADQTGQEQKVYRPAGADEVAEFYKMGKGWVLETTVTFNEVRARAGNADGRYNWEVNGYVS